MAIPGFDANTLISQFEQASTKGSEQLRKAVNDATLRALQGRELSLKNIRSTLGQVSKAAESTLAKSGLPGVDAGDMLDQAVAGMDDALLKAVEANRVALDRLVGQGADLGDKHLKKALTDLEKMEDMLLETVRKSAAAVDAPFGAAWAQVLEKMNAAGTLSGAKAATTVEQLTMQMQQQMRESRSASLRAAQALAESYTAMVSGVLIGMADAMQQGSPGKGRGKKSG